jgi:hypothetical protein
MLEFLLEILLTIAAEGAADVALHAMGLPGVDEGGRRRGPLGLALLGYVVAGAILGALSVWLWPSRVVPPAPVPGLSLVFGPLMVGAAMHLWGRFLRERHHATTHLATFTGGAALAFTIALVRFVWIK